MIKPKFKKGQKVYIGTGWERLVGRVKDITTGQLGYVYKVEFSSEQLQPGASTTRQYAEYELRDKP